MKLTNTYLYVGAADNNVLHVIRTSKIHAVTGNDVMRQGISVTPNNQKSTVITWRRRMLALHLGLIPDEEIFLSKILIWVY